MAGCSAGQHQYASLAGPVALSASTYYLVGQETSGGEQWYDYAPVTPGVGTVNGSVYFAGNYQLVPSPGYPYLPVNFRYSLGSNPVSSVSTTSPPAASVSGTIIVSATATAPAGATLQSIQFQQKNINIGGPVSGLGPSFSVQPIRQL